MNTQKNYTLFKMIYEKQDNALILDYLEQGVSQEELEHFQSGYNAFSVAVFHNNQVVVEKLLSLHQKNPTLNFLNILNNDDDNVLSICVKKMQYGMAELLINYEIQHPGTFNLENTNPMGESFLHYLFFNLNKSTLHTIKLVLQIEHLNVNIQDIQGQTPFIHLMHTFHEDSLKKAIFDYLIHYNKLHDRFDFNLADEDGYSAFLTACTQEDIHGVIKLFLNNPETFNLYAKLKNGKNALALAQDTDETFTQLLFFKGFNNTQYLNDTMPYLNNEALREQVIKKSIECEKDVLEQKLNPSMDKMNQKESKIKKIKV